MKKRKSPFLLFAPVLGLFLFWAGNDRIQDFIDIQKYCASRSREGTPKADIKTDNTRSVYHGSVIFGGEEHLKVLINEAGIESLCLLPGIGRKTALAVIEYRTEHGPFLNPDEILNVRGIGEKKLEMLREYVIIE